MYTNNMAYVLEGVYEWGTIKFNVWWKRFEGKTPVKNRFLWVVQMIYKTSWNIEDLKQKIGGNGGGFIFRYTLPKSEIKKQAGQRNKNWSTVFLKLITSCWFIYTGNFYIFVHTFILIFFRLPSMLPNQVWLI